jgi:hypothetical protein
MREKVVATSMRRLGESPLNANEPLVKGCNGLEGADGKVDGLAVTGAGRADISDHGVDGLAVAFVDNLDPSSTVGGGLGVVGPVRGVPNAIYSDNQIRIALVPSASACISILGVVGSFGKVQDEFPSPKRVFHRKNSP